MTKINAVKINAIKVNEAQLQQVLQAGILFPLEQPCTVEQFLQGHLQLSWEFIEGKLQTIMLNSKVVDDLDKIWLLPSCRLALSGPMPGLVGASLRRHGCLASLREGISMPAAEALAGAGTSLPRVEETIENHQAGSELDLAAGSYQAGSKPDLAVENHQAGSELDLAAGNQVPREVALNQNFNQPFTFELRVYNSALKDLGSILLQKGFWAKLDRLAVGKDDIAGLLPPAGPLESDAAKPGWVWVQA